MNRNDEKEYWELIWEKFRTGDRRAFETIYSEFVDALFAYGMKMTPHRALVEDAIQDTFLDVYNYGSRLRNPGSLEFYLYKTLKRIIIRKLKEKYRFTHVDDFVAQFDLKFPLEESELEELEGQTGMLKDELEKLDAKKRELLFLKFNSGLTYNEIGELLHCKPDTVKKQVHRILKLLRGKLGEDFLELFVMFVRK
ncbi:MAG: sigma-70 family RNA polymerase sigma factor [Mariniphaga sp.]|nr:sigma-70 family RNA polymerase sigma factor [Mariniphaga sp.]